MAVIDIGTVLNKFDDTVGEDDAQVKEYGIRFFTKDGRLRTMRARKNVKSPKQGLRAPLQERGKGTFNLQRHGTMMVEDLDLRQPRTVKVATICGFRDFKETTWSKVRH